MKNIAAFLLLPVLITSSRAVAVPPKIHAQWDNPVSEEDKPQLDTHYEIIATDPNSPNVLLKVGRPDWRIWSTDLDAADGVGDIGTISSPISSPVNQNFSITLAANDRLMLYTGSFIDGAGLINPNDWNPYINNTLPALDQGDSH